MNSSELRALRDEVEENWYQSVKKKILNCFVYLFCPIAFGIFVIGSYDFFRNVESNKCEMTYMFEYPQYVKIPMKNEINLKYPMYGLYEYAEGKETGKARRSEFTGIPVLFLPGNAGSYKQVRSYASVALRKWLDANTPFHFDFFTVDFNDEISGVYGYILERQSQYTKEAVEKIMSLYEDHHHVVVIGHSMGGQIAKSINENQATVELIYTMATPHSQPLLITDPELDLFYYYTSRNWTEVQENDESQVTLISVAGGTRDFFIPEKLTKWPYNTVQTSSPSVPAVWSSTDHLCIVWCKQLVMSVVRSLFDMVEYRKQQKYYAITGNSTSRQAVLQYHFIKRTSGKSLHSAHPVEKPSPPSASVLWNELYPHSFCQGATQKITYLMFPRITFQQKVHHRESPEDKVLVMTSNTKPKNWIFGCASQETVNGIRYCSALVNLSNQTEIIPAFHRRKKLVHLKYSEVVKYSHLVVKMEPAQFKTCVDLEVYAESERRKVLGVKLKTENAIFYNFTYPNTFNASKLFAWRIIATPEIGEDKLPMKCAGEFNSLGIFRNGNFQTHNFFKNESLLIRFADTSVRTSYALVYLDRKCKYTLSVEIAYLETAGQLFRTYARIIPAYFASIVFMTLFFQEATGWKNFHRILLENAYHLCILPGFTIPFLLLIVPNDYRYMMTGAESNLFVPIFAYLVAYGLVLVVSLGSWLVIITSGNAVHAVVMKFLSKKLGSVPEKVTDLAFSITMDRFPFAITAFIVALALSTCGAMGLAVGLVLYLLKIFKGYEAIIEDLVRGKIKNVSEGLSPINFHVHCAMLWFVATILNLPSLIFWIHNFKYNEIPQWDLSMYICLMLSPAISVLWQGFVPNFHPTLWKLQSYLCYGMGLITVIWGTHRIYLISFLVVVVLIGLSICQLISTLAPPLSTPELDPATEPATEEVIPSSQAEAKPDVNPPKREPVAEAEVQVPLKAPVPIPSSKEDLDVESESDVDEDSEDGSTYSQSTQSDFYDIY